MMGRYFVFAFFFLAIQLCPFVSGITQGVIGTSVTVDLAKVHGTIERCEALHLGVINETFQIYPESKDPLIFSEKGFRSSCSFIINDFASKYTGKWIITPYVSTAEPAKTNAPQQVVIYEKKIMETIPDKNIQGVSGERITVYLNSELAEDANCTLRKGNSSDTEVYDLKKGVLPSGIEKRATECGVRMNVELAKDNKWCLIEASGYLIKEGCFDVYMVSDKVVTKTTRTFYEHQAVELDMDVFEDSTTCTIEHKSLERLMPSVDKPCKYPISRISSKHEGIWRIKYKFKSGRMIEKDFNITIQDVPEFTIDVNKTESKIEMRCQAMITSLQQCTFEKPNGTIIDASTALRTAKYDLVETSSLKTENNVAKDCNLTIHNPTEEDYGRWKCSMKDYHLGIKPNIYVEQNIEILKETVYVTRGREMMVNCSLDTGWSFCRVQSPKGYFGSRSKFRSGMQYLSDPSIVQSTNECNMIIASAQDEDIGNWTCLLDTYGGPERKVIVPVRVLDAETIADVMRKDWPKAKNVTTLECRPIPNQNKTIVPGSCIWTKPNGNRVKTDEGKYSMHLSENACHLYSDGKFILAVRRSRQQVIHSDKSARIRRSAISVMISARVRDFDDNDIGEWSCRAMLFNSNHLLGSINVGAEFVYSSWLFGLVTVSIISILATILIFIIIAAVVYYRNHCKGKTYDTAG